MAHVLLKNYLCLYYLIYIMSNLTLSLLCLYYVYIFRPVVVPLEVIRAMINGTDPADCGSGGDTDAHNKKCSTMGSLFNWWRSLRRQAPPPLYARTQHGVSSCSNSGGGSAAGKSGKGAGGTAHMLSGQNVPTWRQYS